MLCETNSRSPRAFSKSTVIDGKPTQIECLDIQGQTFSITRGALTIVKLEDEWYEDVKDPGTVVEMLRQQQTFKPDLFTFWQRVPETEPKYAFPFEWESIAALRITSFEHWLTKQIKPSARNKVRKSERAGVQVRECTFDDEFVRGMTAIFNETPIRQGRPFWHYGKDFQTVKAQFSRYLAKEDLLGAYCDGELVGFAMVGNAGRFGHITQIIAKVEHREKAVMNALLAKSVALCDQKQLSTLVYAYWDQGSLTDFKSQSGFEQMKVPRYFIPLSVKGKLAWRLGLRRGWKTMLPPKISAQLKRARASWYEWKTAR